MKRILFVDDEPRVLDGLRRMLRPFRKEWEMSFAASGAEALAILAGGSYDVIVTDMRMPEMDGAQLLALVREQYPEMIRIVLSGHFDTGAAMRAVPVAHQFLSKPCDPEKLKSAIEACGGSGPATVDDSTRRMIATIGELPALPRTYAALVHALDDPEIPLDRIGAIVESDVAVAAKVLQLVNSAFFGLTREVVTIPMAVGYLGFDVLKQLVITVELFRTFACSHPIPGFSVEELQSHSRCVAGIAACLPVPHRDAAVTSVAALLHDVGKLVLAVRLTDTFECAFRASLQQNRPLYEVEQEITGTNHAQIGAYLLGLWGLPEVVVNAVSQHHCPIPAAPSDKSMDVPMAVQIADRLECAVRKQLKASKSEAMDTLTADLADWSEFLPEWRETAEEIIHREAQSG